MASEATKITSGSLIQTFDTTPGATYHVSFQYVIQQGNGFEDLVADVLGGTVSGVATNSAARGQPPSGIASPASPPAAPSPSPPQPARANEVRRPRRTRVHVGRAPIIPG